MKSQLDRIELIISKFEGNNPDLAPSVYQIMACIVFAIQLTILKILVRLPTAQILIIRSIICLVINGTIITQKKINAYPVENKQVFYRLLYRGILGGVTTQLRFEGLRILPLSEGTVVLNSSLLWTAFFSVFILKKERFSMKLISSIGICSLGILCVARPPQFLNILHLFGLAQSYEAQSFTGDIALHTVGVLLCLCTAFVQSTIQIMISSLQGQVSQFLILQYFSIFTIPLASIQLFYSPHNQIQIPDLFETFLLLIIGISGCFAQWFMNRAYLLGDLTKMAILGQSTIVIYVLLDLLVFHSQLNGLSFLGICCLILSAALEISQKKNKKK